MQKQKPYSIEQLVPVINSFFDDGKDVIISAAGNSMYPLIRNYKDAIVLTAYKGQPLHIGDMIFYKRKSGQYVLHRIVGVEDNGFVLLGDNQTQQEKGITKEQVIAIPTAIVRGKKIISVNSKGYSLYKKMWTKSKVLRRVGICFFGFRIWLSKRLKNNK